MKVYASKLIDLTEQHADRIAKQWAKDVRQNTKTPFYHGLPESMITRQASEFYHNFRKMFFNGSPYESALRYFERYAAERYAEGVPLHEAIYALIMMRRHIWLYAEFQAIFVTSTEQQQAVESLSRTILMFDYAMFVITRKYQELSKLSWFETPNT